MDAAIERTVLYVALTRGKKENRAYCVTDTAFCFDAEDAHFHMVGLDEELTPRQVMLRTVANDKTAKTAHFVAEEELNAAMSTERLTQLYRYGCELATGDSVEELSQRIFLRCSRRWLIALCRAGWREAQTAMGVLCGGGLSWNA